MTNKAPLTLQWDVDADWLYSVLRYADKNPDQFPDAAEDKITLDTDDVQIIIDALNKPDLTARIAELEAKNAELERILDPVRTAVARAEKLGRNVDEWIAYAKALELDAGGAAGKEANEQRAKNLALRNQIKKLEAAARALIERWDTPLWKDVPATGNYINALRAALGEKE